MHSLEAETKIINREGRNIHIDISVARIWGGIGGYALLLLALLEILNDSEGLRIILENCPFLKQWRVVKTRMTLMYLMTIV